MRARICFVVLSLFACSAAPLVAQSEEQKLAGSLDDGFDQFGFDVDVDGGVMIVGGTGGGFGGGDPGRAYIYRNVGGSWTEEAVLARVGGGKGEEFGRAVAIEGDVAFVGAPFENGTGYEGAVYVFERIAGTWTEVGKLTSPSPEPDNFGSALAVQGDVLVVGDPQDDSGPGSDPGKAFVFVRPVTGWVSSSTAASLTASDAAFGDFFGAAVAIDGDTIVVGAYSESGSGAFDGAAYVYVEPASGWASASETAKLTCSASDSELGYSVAVDGDHVVVGAPLTFNGVAGRGAAFLYDEPAGGWVDMLETQRFDTTDAGSPVRFGHDVAIDGDWIVIGAPGSIALANLGVVDAYRFDVASGSWLFEWKCHGSDSSVALNYDAFGSAVTLDGPIAVVGAPDDDLRDSDSGAAYVVALDPPSATFTAYGSGPLTLTGSVVGPCDNDLAIVTSGAPANAAIGMLIVSLTPDLVGTPAPPFVLHVAPPWIISFVGSYDAAGTLTVTGSLPLGSTIGAQLWCQTFALGGTTKLHSNGLELTIVP